MGYLHSLLHDAVIVIAALLTVITIALAGQEVLYKFQPQPDDLKPHELAVIQYESRPLGGYWNTSARWNKAFCDKFGHQHYLITNLEGSTDCDYAGHKLAPAWCKVKAMLHANTLLSIRAKAFLYIDSDVVITVQSGNYSLTTLLAFIRSDKQWDMKQRPVAFNQDGPGWACKFTLQTARYSRCFNSGAVFWRRGHVAEQLLSDWWHSAGEPYGKNRFPSKWRVKWPWEQAQMYEMYQRYQEQVMVLSFPELPSLPWTSKKNPKSQYPTDAVEPYCFCHWPGAGCFLTHHCASQRQKQKMGVEYALPQQQIKLNIISI